MPKAMKTQKTQAAEAPSATELMLATENGDDAEVEARIQQLSQQDFIRVMRAVQRLDTALSNYAQSWQGAECWGRGTPYPA